MFGLTLGLDLDGRLRRATMRTATNAAGVSAISDTNLPDGEIVYAQTFRDYFSLYKSGTDTVNGTTVLATLSGTGRWRRLGIRHPSWALQAAWYIDPVSGNDENGGGSGVALKTLAELDLRIGARSYVNQKTDLFLMSATPASDPLRITSSFGPLGWLRVKGSKTTLASGTITTYTAPVRTSPGTPTQITDTAQASWGTYVNKRLRITSGARAGATSWVAKNAGSNTIYTPGWMTWSTASYIVGSAPGVQVTPVAGDPYVVEDLTQLGAIVFDYAVAQNPPLGNSAACAVSFEDVIMPQTTGSWFPMGVSGPPVASTYLFGCDFRDASGLQGYDATVASNIAFVSCRAAVGGNSVSTEYRACLFPPTTISAAGAFWTLYNDCLLQGGRLRVRRYSLVATSTNGLCVMDSASHGVTVEQCGQLRLGGPLYGSNNALAGLQVNTGALANYASSTSFRPTITGTSGDLQLGSVAPATGVRVFDDTTGAWGASKVATSWANLAAARPGGFGDHVTDPVTGASFGLTEA
jgi:hypothetical protein